MVLFIIPPASSPSGGFGSTIRAILLTNIAHAGMINKRLSRACIEDSRISNRDEIFSLLVMAKYFQRLSMTTKIPWLTTPLILTSAFVFVFFTSLKLADPPVSFDDGDAIRERSAGENSVDQAEIEGARSRSPIDQMPSRSLAAQLRDLRSRGLRQIGELQRQLSKKSYYYQLLR